MKLNAGVTWTPPVSHYLSSSSFRCTRSTLHVADENHQHHDHEAGRIHSKVKRSRSPQALQHCLPSAEVQDITGSTELVKLTKETAQRCLIIRTPRSARNLLCVLLSLLLLVRLLLFLLPFIHISVSGRGRGGGLPWSRYLLDQTHCRMGSFNQTLVTYASDNPLQNWTETERVLREVTDEKNFTTTYENHILVITTRVTKDLRTRILSAFHRTLTNWAEQNDYAPEVMQDLLRSVKAPIDEHYLNFSSSSRIEPGLRGSGFSSAASQGPARYRSCAVVGNSGVIMNGTWGDFIDSHEMVIRLNNAKLVSAGMRMPPNQSRALEERIKRSVGSKTTLSFINSHVLHQSLKIFRNCEHLFPYGKEVPIMSYMCIPQHALSMAFCVNKTSEHHPMLLLTDRRFDIFVQRIAAWYSIKHFLEFNQTHTIEDWKKKHKREFHHSSGMQAVVLALGLCEKVNLFGFGKNPRMTHHFHNGQRLEHYAHDFEAEYLLYNDLQTRRIYENPFLCQAGVDIPPVHIF